MFTIQKLLEKSEKQQNIRWRWQQMPGIQNLNFFSFSGLVRGKLNGVDSRKKCEKSEYRALFQDVLHPLNFLLLESLYLLVPVCSFQHFIICDCQGYLTLYEVCTFFSTNLEVLSGETQSPFIYATPSSVVCTILCLW